MEASLADRIRSYQDLSDYQLLKQLPVIIVLNVRSCSKLTSLIDKPFSADFVELMISVVAKLCQDVDGIVLSYTYNDQIVLAIRNDQTPTTDCWYNNKIQPIVSAASSIATLEFNRVRVEKNIKLFGDAIFTAKTFAVPNIIELTNVIIHMQQNCFHKSLSESVFYELLKLYPSEEVTRMLAGKTPKQKSEILLEKCKVDYNSYPIAFKRGIAAYRAPKLNTKNGQIKNKFIINDELPLFSQQKDWLLQILKTGTDIVKLDKNGNI